MIEKNIHQIWVGPYRLPEHLKKETEKIKHSHPAFSHFLWTNHNRPELPQELELVYQRSMQDHPAMASDLLRLYLCYEYGGLYLDIDFVMHHQNQGANNIDFDRYNAIIINHIGPVDTFTNGAMACQKHHPLWRYLLDSILSQPNYPHVWLGPSWMGTTVKQYFSSPDNITHDVFEKQYLKPNQILAIEFYRDFCNNHFYHHALASWQHGSEWNIKLKNGDYE